MVSDSVTMFGQIWQVVMVSEIVRGASISKLYVPAYEDYVVGEQSLEWRLICGMNKKDSHYEIFSRYETQTVANSYGPDSWDNLDSVSIVGAILHKSLFLLAGCCL